MTIDAQFNSEPLVTIVMPYGVSTRPFALDYLDVVSYPQDKIEVIIVRGLFPCYQRNIGAKLAQGEILVFLDDDSAVEPDYFEVILPHFNDPEIAGVGGPNPGVITPKFIPKLVEAVLTSPIGTLSKYHRYTPTGNLKEAGDNELILCNFAMRRETFLELGGLDERLYPNEENEFYERFWKKYPDKKLVYDPALVAREPRPESFLFFLKKIFGYGRGRSRQFKISLNLRGFLHMLCCSAIFLPLLLMSSTGAKLFISILVMYLIVLLGGAIANFVKMKMFIVSLSAVPAFAATHVAYLLGMWKGLFEDVTRPQGKSRNIKVSYYDLNSRQETPISNEEVEKRLAEFELSKV